MNAETRRITFPGAFGDELAARLDAPDAEPIGYALLAHCFTCSKDLKGLRRISRRLAERGIAVLRFDFTGLGESEGDFAETDFSSNLDDLVAAAEWLGEHHEPPKLLIGHSLGGAAVLAGAPRVDAAVAVATIGAPASTEHLAERLFERTPELKERDEAEIDLAGRRFRIGRQLLEDLRDDHVQRTLDKLDRALMIFHSPADEIVGIENARRIYEGARHPKSFVSLDDADHLLSRERDSELVAGVLAAWAARYLA